MPSAKAVYEPDEGWKHRQCDSAQWDALGVRLRQKLRPFYPDKAAVECETFGHPADAWVNYSLSAAWSSISIIYGLGLRLTKEQIAVEQQDILATLQKAVRVLSSVSPDVDRLFGVDADVLGTRDKILKLVPFVEASKTQINSLPKALKRNEADRAAAVEVAIRVLRIFKDHGGRISATADADHILVSDAVSILQILGDELGLCLSPATWKKVVTAAKQQAKDLKKVRKAPKEMGA
jgi:hypothetical protein